jgi:hypothetical protein
MNCGSCLLIKLRSLICIFSLVDLIQFSYSMCYKSKDIIDLYLDFLYVQYSVALQNLLCLILNTRIGLLGDR